MFYYPDGSKYEGCWRKDLKHGEGTYTYANGDKYSGNWYKGKRHGLGEYYFAEADCCFRGTWVNGVRVGPAEVHYKNHTLHGIWDDKHPQGPAVFSFSCKYMYKGYYKLLRERSPIGGTGPEEGGEFGEGEEEMGKDEFKLDLENEGEGEFDLDQRTSTTSVQRAIPRWYCQELLQYDFSKLPQQPIPLPISDSEEDVCDLSSKPSAVEPSVYDYEAEQVPTTICSSSTNTSLSWSGATSPCVSTTPDISQNFLPPNPTKLQTD